MSKQSKTPPLEKGTADAKDIYFAVGFALSYWEASEDVLMGLFNWLCADREPTAAELYVSSGRAVRAKMLLSAIDRYGDHLDSAEIKEVREAMKALDLLAPTRNQIAHGHVSKIGMTRDNKKVMDGHYLVPSLNELGQHISRDFRYAHTADQIHHWSDKVRHERARVMDITAAARMRQQNKHRKMGSDAQMNMSIAKAIVGGQIPPEAFEMTPKNSESSRADES